MKLLLVLIDGMGDRPAPLLGGETPLEFAEIPNMDSLTRRGQTGSMYTVAEGIAPESHIGAISVLGYDPFRYTANRGVLEAVGAGMVFRDGDLALRCNFVTLGEELTIIDRRVGRNLTSEESGLLAREISRKVRLESYPAEFEFKSTIGYRGALVIRSRETRLSDNISGTDPAYYQEKNLNLARPEFEMVAQRSQPLDDSESAKVSAILVNEFSEKVRPVLERSKINRMRAMAGKLKANYILTRDAGATLPGFSDINRKYNVRFASLVNMPVEKGIAALTGMKAIEVPPPSEDMAQDCEVLAERFLENLQVYDCFYAHIKGPDEPGHDGECMKKAKLLEMIDKHFFGRLLGEVDRGDLLVCITADHATPCVARTHTDDPVPVLISGGKVVSDGSDAFSEKVCARGGFGMIERGVELMPRLMALTR